MSAGGLSLAQVAARLGVSRTRVHQLVMAGTLRAVPVEGGRNGRQSWSVTEREIRRFAALDRPPGRPRFERSGRL